MHGPFDDFFDFDHDGDMNPVESAAEFAFISHMMDEEEKGKHKDVFDSDFDENEDEFGDDDSDSDEDEFGNDLDSDEDE